MSIDRFVADPASYCKSHIVQFTHQTFRPAQVGMQVASAMNKWGGNWAAEEYQMIPNQYTRFKFRESGLKFTGGTGQERTMPTRVGKGAHNLHTVEVDYGAVDLGIRFLPWKENTVTYMCLDPAARTFFTGPINGCSVYLGRIGTIWWAFHANRNNAGAHNAAIKASMTDAVNKDLPVRVQIMHSAVYQIDYNNQGFVFGHLKQGQWRFFIVDMTMGAAIGVYQQTVRRLP